MSNSHQEVLSAYATHQHNNQDGREVDKRALLKAANMLQIALDTKGQDMNIYREAIRFNQELWTLFQVALCDQDNKLPDETKVLMLNISRYVDRTSFRAVVHYTPQLVQSLIDVNKTIAVGLAKKLQSQQQQQPMMIDQPPPTDVRPVMISA